MGKTVLIVDDHPSFRASARRMLEATATRWLARRRMAARRSTPSVNCNPTSCCWISGCPIGDGFQVAERLAANGAAAAIVLTSSRDRSDFAYEIVASPAHGFIPKSELSAEAIASLVR